LLTSHGALLVTFVLISGLLSEQCLLDIYNVHLPHLYPYAMLDGEIRIDAGDYLVSVLEWAGCLGGSPLFTSLLAYGSLCLFLPAAISARAWRRGAVVLFLAGMTAYAAAWFGVGVTFFSRGWFAGYLHVPEWWAVFSLYITLACCTLCVGGSARLVTLALARAWKSLGEGDARSGRRSKKDRSRRPAQAAPVS